MGQGTALGPARGARGVDEGGGAAGFESGTAGGDNGVRYVLAECLQPAQGAGVELPEMGEVPELLPLLADQPALLLRLHGAGDGPGVLEDPARLEGRGRGVDGHGDQPGRPGGEVEQCPLVGRTGHDRDAVTAPESLRDQTLGDRLDLLGELGGGHVLPGAVRLFAAEDRFGGSLPGVVEGDLGERAAPHLGCEGRHGHFTDGPVGPLTLVGSTRTGTAGAAGTAAGVDTSGSSTWGPAPGPSLGPGAGAAAGCAGSFTYGCDCGPGWGQGRSRMAVTPWPPAAQTEIRPRRGRPLREELGQRRHDPCAGRGEGVPGGEGRPGHVQPVPVDGGEALLLPGGEGREDLGGEGLVNLEEVEVLHGQPGALQHARHGVRGRHQQPVLAVHVVHGGRLVQRQVGQRFQAVGPGPLLARQEHGGGAVGERCRIARGHRRVGVAGAEHRLQRGEFLHRGAGAQVLVAFQAEVRDDEVVQETAFVRRGEPLVAGRRQQVLVLAGHAPLPGGDGRVLAHRQAGTRLGVARDVRDEVAGADGGQRLEPGPRRPGAARLQQDPAQPVVDAEGRVARGVRAARDRRVDRAEGDLVRRGDDGLQPGAARLLDVVGGGTRVESGAQHGLARQVEVPAVLEDRAGHELSDLLVPQAEALDEPVQCGGQHVLVGRPGVRAVGAGERDAAAADDRDPARPRTCEGDQLDQLISTTPDP